MASRPSKAVSCFLALGRKKLSKVSDELDVKVAVRFVESGGHVLVQKGIQIRAERPRSDCPLLVNGRYHHCESRVAARRVRARFVRCNDVVIADFTDRPLRLGTIS